MIINKRYNPVTGPRHDVLLQLFVFIVSCYISWSCQNDIISVPLYLNRKLNISHDTLIERWFVVSDFRVRKYMVK